MKTTSLIAADSIRALLHQRLLVGLMVASLALTIVFSILLSSVRRNLSETYGDQAAAQAASGTNAPSQSEQARYQASLGNASSALQAGFYGLASLGGSIVSLFIFSTAVTSEIRKGTIRLTLSKPVSRTQFLLGKYLGGVAVMAGYAVIASLAFCAFALPQGVAVDPALKWAPWLMFCAQLMLGSVALLLSLFMHPLVAGIVAFFAGNGFCSPHNPLYYILPSYRSFNVLSHLLAGTLIRWQDVLFLSLYAADTVIILLLLALWRFRTKALV